MMNAHEICKAAIEHYGRETQIITAIEEMAELIQAICKRLRGYDNFDNFSEEMADVNIMLRQLYMMFPKEGMHADAWWMGKKLERLESRIAGKKRAVVRRVRNG